MTWSEKVDCNIEILIYLSIEWKWIGKRFIFVDNICMRMEPELSRSLSHNMFNVVGRKARWSFLIIRCNSVVCTKNTQPYSPTKINRMHGVGSTKITYKKSSRYTLEEDGNIREEWDENIIQNLIDIKQLFLYWGCQGPTGSSRNFMALTQIHITITHK